jgi:hypothetical protein
MFLARILSDSAMLSILQVKYNQKRVDNFSRMRYQRTVFRAWKAYFLIQFKVKRKYQAKLTQFVRSAFVAWAGVSHTQHRLRLTTYQVRRNLGCVVW